MNVFFLIMYVLSIVCFLLSAFGRESTAGHPPYTRLVALGLVFFAIPPLVQTASVVFAGG